LGLVRARLAAEPLAIAAGIIVTIEGQTIAEGAHRAAIFIVAAFETSQRVFVGGVLAQVNGAQSLEVVVDKEENLVIAFPGIADDFADVEVRQTLLDSLEAGFGLEMVVTIGGDEGAGDGPVGKQAIVDDVEGFGLVAKVMLAA